jgi:CRISPR system Cascade subunit CasB
MRSLRQSTALTFRPARSAPSTPTTEHSIASTGGCTNSEAIERRKTPMEPSPPKMRESDFVAHLKGLAECEDRGALAALRRGLGMAPGTCTEMHRYVVRFLPQGCWTWRGECRYVVAALFGLHPVSTSEGNFGDTMRVVKDKGGGDSIEKRFIALLKCHRDDLFDHLRQAVSLARSKDVRVHWEQLLQDIQDWDDESAGVQRNWARAFWGNGNGAGRDTAEPSATGEEK